MAMFWVHTVTASRVYVEMEGTSTGLHGQIVELSDVLGIDGVPVAVVVASPLSQGVPGDPSHHAIQLHFKHADMLPTTLPMDTKRTTIYTYT